MKSATFSVLSPTPPPPPPPTPIVRPPATPPITRGALLGWRDSALALVGIVSIDGRRNGDNVMENPFGGFMGDTYRQSRKRVDSGLGGTEEPTTPPSSAQYMGRM